MCIRANIGPMNQDAEGGNIQHRTFNFQRLPRQLNVEC
jgi:hypothetical protein